MTVRLDDGRCIPVDVRRSWQARRLSLRVSQIDGRVSLTLPSGASRSQGEAFLFARRAWLRAAVAGIVPPVVLAPGTTLPVEGRALTVRRGPVRRVEAGHDTLTIPERGRCGALVAAWLRLQARDRAMASVARHAAALGRRAGRLRLADPRGRWGSCSAAGDIMLSWRLILAPPEVLDYVAAHEVAHLAQMNHSPAFWAVVARLMPDYGPRRAWLRRHGAALHRWRFDDDPESPGPPFARPGP